MLMQNDVHRWIVRIMSLIVMVSIFSGPTLAQTDSLTPLRPAKSQKQLKRPGLIQDIRSGRGGILLQEYPSNKTPKQEDQTKKTPKPLKGTPVALVKDKGWGIYRKADDTLKPISDCTTTKIFEVTATKRGWDSDGDADYKEHEEPAEKMATEGVMIRFLTSIDRIMADCKCTHSDCLIQSVQISRNKPIFRYSRKDKRGWEARVDEAGTVKISCPKKK